ncbi:MAG: hypothetical protein HKN44_04105 [Ilumatobacter sp.]|nr:hypothetical protein [Ilumatobacter sp.]
MSSQASSSSTHPFFEVRPTLLISHSGDTAPTVAGGTLTAFKRAHDLGFRAFQVDVVAGPDGSLLSIHAVFGRKRRLERCSLDQARERAGADVPTLAELFERFPSARWNIEFKSTRCVGALMDHIRSHPRHDLLCVSGPFHRRALRRLRRQFPDVATNAALVEGALLGVPLLPRHTAGPVGIQLFAPLAVGPIVRWNTRNGRSVQAWTVNDADRLATLRKRGVSGFIVDDYEAVADAASADV